jgi:hypothetical protein
MPRTIDIPENVRKRLRQAEMKLTKTREEIRVLQKLLRVSEELESRSSRATPRPTKKAS